MLVLTAGPVRPGPEWPASNSTRLSSGSSAGSGSAAATPNRPTSSPLPAATIPAFLLSRRRTGCTGKGLHRWDCDEAPQCNEEFVVDDWWSAAGGHRAQDGVPDLSPGHVPVAVHERVGKQVVH